MVGSAPLGGFWHRPGPTAPDLAHRLRHVEGASGVSVAARQLATRPHPAVNVKNPLYRARAWWGRRLFHFIRVATWAACILPRRSAIPVSRALALAVAASPKSARDRHYVALHQSRARGVVLQGRARDDAVRDAFASYGRYWMESLRLRSMAPEQVDAAFTIEGLEHIQAALAAGTGAILAPVSYTHLTLPTICSV